MASSPMEAINRSPQVDPPESWIDKRRWPDVWNRRVLHRGSLFCEMLEIAGLAGFLQLIWTEWSMFNKKCAFHCFSLIAVFVLNRLSLNYLETEFEEHMKTLLKDDVTSECSFFFGGGPASERHQCQDLSSLNICFSCFSDRYFLVFLLWFCGVIFLFASSQLRWVSKACWCWWLIFKSRTTCRTFWYVQCLRKITAGGMTANPM